MFVYSIKLLYLIHLYFLFEKLFSERKVNGSDSEDSKNGRLFSNPIGLFGHDFCSAKISDPAMTGKISDQTLTGICYNEVECAARGGTLTGYCDPPAVKGVCCVFLFKDCATRVRDRTAYFRNKSYPQFDSDPFQCLLNIKPMRNICWVRFIAILPRNNKLN